MASIPFIPGSAPFSPEQRAWLNGYLAGMFSDANLGKPGEDSTEQAPKEPLLVMYGSQSGSAEGLAKQFAKQADQKGFAPQVMELNDYAKTDLSKQRQLVVITSTWGEGDPPDNAMEFWNYIKEKSAPKLENLNYAVLALGDTNYSEFCGAGKNFDERLSALGAKRLLNRLDCDVDYEESADKWIGDLWGKLKVGQASSLSRDEGGSTNASAAMSITETSEQQETTWCRKNPFSAKLITNRKLNRAGSAKDTRHFEISLEGSGLEYEVGDALGVCGLNCPRLADEIVLALEIGRAHV